VRFRNPRPLGRSEDVKRSQLLQNHLATVWETRQGGLASLEHQAFKGRKQTQIYPPLDNGDSRAETLRDRLSSREVERRYAAMTTDQKAELIEGVVYMASPLRFTTHAEPHGRLITWLGVYQAATPPHSNGD
jgi:hypothetical protein